MNISKKRAKEERVIELGDVKIFWRPFPYDEIKAERGDISRMDVQKQMLVYCVTKWEGINDEDAEPNGEGVYPPMECNKENKEFIFAHEHGLRARILAEIDSEMVGKVTALKNLLRLQNGKATKTKSNVKSATTLEKEVEHHPATDATNQ